ncbi:MAG: hypothetical protein U1A73_07670, partial [Pseudomonas sp.]|nr:hypothetical protein [Pseudomonas sp.]
LRGVWMGWMGDYQQNAWQQLLQGTWRVGLLLRLQQCMSRIAVFPFSSTAYSCRAFTANRQKAGNDGACSVHAIGDRIQMNRRFFD